MSSNTSTTVLPATLTEADTKDKINSAWDKLIHAALTAAKVDPANYRANFFHSGKVTQGFREMRRIGGDGPKWYVVSAFGEVVPEVGGHEATTLGRAAFEGKDVTNNKKFMSHANAAKVLPKLAAYGKAYRAALAAPVEEQKTA